MADDFDRILDECINRLNRGDGLADCLTDYPAHAARLESLLRSVRGVQAAYAFTPSAEARREARQKFQAALERRQARGASFLKLRPVIWAAVAVLILAVVGIWGVRPALSPPPLTPGPAGNFVFLISDEVNAISDFSSLNVTISSIGIQAGDGGKWTELAPAIKTVDLTQLQGDKSQEIWRGDVPAGQYSQVFIYVSRVEGRLKPTGQTIEVKLPSSKLHVAMPFEVTPGVVTSFTFDVTVVAAGNNGKYILKPQISESGTRQRPAPSETGNQ